MRFSYNEFTSEDLKALAGSLQASIQELGTANYRYDAKQKSGWPIRCTSIEEKDGTYIMAVEMGAATLSQAWLGGGHTASFNIIVKQNPAHLKNALIEVADHGDGFLETDNSVTSSRSLPNRMKASYETRLTSTPADFKQDLHNFLCHQEHSQRVVSDHKLGFMGADEVEQLQDDRSSYSGYVMKPQSVHLR